MKNYNELEDYKYDVQCYIERQNDLDNLIKEIDGLKFKLLDMKHKGENTLFLEEKIDCLTKKREQEENKLSTLRQKATMIERHIESLPQPAKTILYFKYIKGYTFDEIAQKMNYSSKRIYQLHKVALEKYIESNSKDYH